MSTTRAVRATFVMEKGSRDLLRGVSQRYGVSQSEIMNTAPFLFIVMAQRSLNERRKQLRMAKTLAEQASQSLNSMPGHLVIGDAHDRIAEAMGLEEQSIEKNRVHGPSEGDIHDFMGRAFNPFGDPCSDTVDASLEEVGAKATVERYRAPLGTRGH